MSVSLNHTIVHASDAVASARFLTGIMGLPEPGRVYHFEVVELGNGVSLDYMDSDQITPQHYAFLVSEAEFDGIYGRIQEQGVAHWADPMQRQAGQINHGDGGRGVYFADPDGHLMEALTRPYGSGSTEQ
jgi:catechol 2,3-dioxygenase-like lactoylglutathione lyase family enzyme